MAGYAAKPLGKSRIDDAIDFVLELEKTRDVATVAALLSA
jgi:hypothetical protein